MQVRYLNSFDKTFDELSENKKNKVIKAANMLLNFFETKSRPTKGIGLKKLRKNFWEIRIDIKLRILFEIQKDLLVFILVGNHNDIRKYIKRI